MAKTPSPAEAGEIHGHARPKAADAFEGLGEQLAVEDGGHGPALLGAIEVDGTDEAVVDAGQLGFDAAHDVLGGQPAQ